MSHPETKAHPGTGTRAQPVCPGTDPAVPLLREALSDVLGLSPTRAAVKRIVEVFLRGAEAHLRRRMAPHTGRIDRFGLSLHDLAIDCVAGLLARDPQGGFPHLERYFTNGWTELDDAAIMFRVRRLICGAVDDGLYRRYAEHDPQLARLIRSLQRSCAARSDVTVDRRMGTLQLVVRGPTRSSCLPVSRDRIEAHMMAHIRATDSASDYLGYFVDLLHTEQDVVLCYPLVGVALAVRTALARLNTFVLEPAKQECVEDAEAEELIRATVRVVATECRPRYVGKGKVDDTVFAAYCAAVENVLLSTYRHDGGVTALGDSLRDYLPDVSRQAYREHHRARCEYLLRLVKERLKYRLRNLRTFSAEPLDGNE
jgi:hypothetical protein